MQESLNWKTQLANLPGSTHNNDTGSADDQQPGGDDSAEAIMANLPHNKRAAESGF